MEDLLKMRRRILPQLARWEEQQKRIAIYGIGTHTQALLGSMPALMPLVNCFIDKKGDGTYLGRICVKPDMIHEPDFDVVIYSSKRWERDMYQNLAHLGSIEHVLLYGLPNAEHSLGFLSIAPLQQRVV